MSGIGTPLLTQSFELLSGSIGWGAGLQISRLVFPLLIYIYIYIIYKNMAEPVDMNPTDRDEIGERGDEIEVEDDK